jgi:hypothetical protein
MAPFPNWLRNSLLAGWKLALPALAEEVPAGAQLQVRLKTKIASNTSRPDDPVETIVIALVMVNGALAIPAGVTLRGVVTAASAATDPAVRATLALDFRELEMGGQRIRVHTVLTAVENARESVNDKDEIQGVLANETLSARMDSGIGKVAEKYSGFGGFLSAAKNAVFKETEGDIAYDSGVEMDLKLTAALTLTGPPPPGPDAALQPVADRPALIDLVNRQPFQSRAQNPPKPSDVTTLMFIGRQEQLQGAFADAGWSQASKLGGKSKFETLRAIAEDRGYSEAPAHLAAARSAPGPAGVDLRRHARHRYRLFGQGPYLHPQDRFADRYGTLEGGQRFVADRQGAIAVAGRASQRAAARPECDGRQFEYGRSEVGQTSRSVEMGLRPSNRDENPLVEGGQSWPQPPFEELPASY